MRTQWEKEGVGPSRMNSWCHAGGEMKELGGAVMVQVLPLQLKSGNIVLPPIMFPCVLDVAATSETRIVPVLP